MKKLFAIATLAILFAACEKDEIRRNCPVVLAAKVPAVVTTAFEKKYPTQAAEKWFNKDNHGYCALVLVNGAKKLVEFDNDGNFVNEQTEVDQHGDHHDNQDDNECECETDD